VWHFNNFYRFQLKNVRSKVSNPHHELQSFTLCYFCIKNRQLKRIATQTQLAIKMIVKEITLSLNKWGEHDISRYLIDSQAKKTSAEAEVFLIKQTT
jgi:hypothetical protein